MLMLPKELKLHANIYDLQIHFMNYRNATIEKKTVFLSDEIKFRLTLLKNITLF